MRIISGDFKGKKIFLPKDKLTRPLKDFTKESIFNIISHSKLLDVSLENSNILLNARLSILESKFNSLTNGDC